ncbi:exo-alpha-sialidase [Streptomyces gamaensis]|uniref:exo-alpha-sialidase n=1 Tax=Streptomyces gamaensis TaxID=1763542 RepID=A0ABW0YWZ9_9ACTN
MVPFLPAVPFRLPAGRALLRGGSAVLAGLLLVLSAPPGVARQAPGFAEQVLFKAGDEPGSGYACFRIPALAATPRGTLLAFAEGRRGTCGDATDIDIVVKRSTDGGRSWDPLRVVDAGRGDTHGNPAPVVDRRTGRIVLLSTRNAGRRDAANCAVPCDRTPYAQVSDDDGAGWSRPRELTAALRPRAWNSWYATGPGHGIQLTHGPHRGRLLVGVNAESRQGSRAAANHAALALSDDGGATWRLGAVDSFPVAPDGTYRQMPSELALAERRDGSVYVNGREQNGTDLGNRDEAVSRDGGAGFAAPFRALPDLYAPTVQASVLQLRPGRWLFASPADPDRRRAMTLRSSYDQGRAWEPVERGRRVSADWSGYSDLALLAPGTAGLLFEAGRADAREEIRFARFTEEWLGRPRRGPGPTTPDLAPGARGTRGAEVLGGVRRVAGRSGGALAFDGVDAAVRVPFRTGLPLGTRDFTASLWFRSRPGARPEPGEQPLLWMGGPGGAPKAVLRAPRRGFSGTVTAVEGTGPARTATATSTAGNGPYADGRWHHVALRRGGGRITLTVDGTSTSVPDVPGTVSRTSTFGVHVGQRPDGRAYLTGDLRDVRLYGRALTDGELTRLRTPDAAAAHRDLLLWLPLDRVRPGAEAGRRGW